MNDKELVKHITSWRAAVREYRSAIIAGYPCDENDKTKASALKNPTKKLVEVKDNLSSVHFKTHGHYTGSWRWANENMVIVPKEQIEGEEKSKNQDLKDVKKSLNNRSDYHVHFSEIDISGQRIGDEGVYTLINWLIEDGITCDNLRLYKNIWGDLGMMSIAYYCKTLVSWGAPICELHLTDCYVTKKGCEYMFKTVCEQKNPNIRLWRKTNAKDKTREYGLQPLWMRINGNKISGIRDLIKKYPRVSELVGYRMGKDPDPKWYPCTGKGMMIEKLQTHG